jgi:hypothetical protein
VTRRGESGTHRKADESYKEYVAATGHGIKCQA